MEITRREFLEVTAASAAAGVANAQAADKQSLAPAGQLQGEISDKGWAPRNDVRQPNILIAVLDDVGFADLSCYGSEYQMPFAEGMAKTGTRFNNFHVTAVCAPTRACLLTGRNAHSVGVGNIAEWAQQGQPGYKGWIRQDAATMAEVLRAQGYYTSACGKWHMTPLEDQNGSGPFDSWPTGRGFDHWYGFHGSAVDHWHPELFENVLPVYPDKGEDYHLSVDLVDKSINYIQNHLVAAPDKPFFHYIGFGACHFPLHVPEQDIKRQKGKFDSGYDFARQQRFERQKELGIVPQQASLPEANGNHHAWDDLSLDEKRYAARTQEVYAAFLEHTDAQMQRLTQFLKEEGVYDDTIIMFLSDNGATASAGRNGMHDVRRASYLKEPWEERLANIDLLGSELSQPANVGGWAQASNTPLKWYKSDTYEGGIRSPLLVTWPNGNLPKGKINQQYHHAIDVLPTLLNMANLEMPAQRRGQKPLEIHGTSFAYTFDNPQAASKKGPQYYETLGDRAMWKDGWKAVTRHVKGEDFEQDVWELYNTAEDYSEVKNLADVEPERMKELIALWYSDAQRYDVLPLEDDTLKLYKASVPKPRATHVLFPGMTRLDRLSAPDIYNFDSVITVEMALENDRANGVILASGDSSSGYELFLQNGYLHIVYVYTRDTIYTFKSGRKLPQGEHKLRIEINKTGGDSAIANVSIGGQSFGIMELPKLWPIYTPNSGLRCGENRHAPISRAYQSPFIFDQKLKRVVVDVDIS
jgi:arylsulfatase A-like enzyme